MTPTEKRKALKARESRKEQMVFFALWALLLAASLTPCFLIAFNAN